MGPCCVEGCEITNDETFYFEFPTSRILRRKWLELIPIPGKLPLGTVVCSKHFNSDDYESVRGKVRLKRKVVPSLLLGQKPSSPKNTPPEDLPTNPTPPETPKPNSSPPADPSPDPTPEPTTTPASPPKPVDQCDSTTVSVPSPVDAEKMIDDIQRRITVSINKLIGAQNGVKSPPPPLDHREDIEDMITNYHIKNKVPNPALAADLVPPVMDPVPQVIGSVPEALGLVPREEAIDLDKVREADPVFIEVSVDKDASAGGAASQDCLMVLESVQVEVDPTTMLLAHAEDYYYDQQKADKKDDPISLLTSSDEDDVILQEPHIDTVEVSDETDEDDMPLVQLVKKKPEKKKLSKRRDKIKKPKETFEKIMWGMYDFYCVQCHFTTKNSSEYHKHVCDNSTVLHVCPICSYTSSSKSMYTRHTRIHKVERKFKCHLCDYRARHKMSLIYHLKSHDNNLSVNECKKCSFKSDDKVKVLAHFRSCGKSEKVHECQLCDYTTKKKSDLKRHQSRRHRDMCDDDVDFVA